MFSKIQYLKDEKLINKIKMQKKIAKMTRKENNLRAQERTIEFM
jgi:hypothetical protein